MPCPGDPGPRPSFIAVPDTCRLVMRYTTMGQTIENVHYFSRTGGYDSGTLAALCTAADAAWQANLKPALPAGITLVDITATDQSVVSGVQSTLAVGTAGTLAQTVFEDPGATFAIKFGTGQSGRSYRGRMYYPLLTSNFIANGALSSAQANFYLAAVADFFADILADSGDQHVIASYQNDCEWRTTAVATPVIQYTWVDLNLDSQRRRLPGRGI